MNKTQKRYFLKSVYFLLAFSTLFVALFSLFLDISNNDFFIISVFILTAMVSFMFLNFKFINEIMEDRYIKKQRLKQKMESKIRIKNRQRNDMISAIAHEFRNPISVIMGYAQTLTDDPNIDTDLRIKFLSKIYDNSQKIEEVLARLILWNKFESKSAKLDITNFSLKELTNEIILSLKDKYIYRRIIINGDDSMVNGDRLLIGIVIQNLIENALKYSSLDVVVDILDKQVTVSDKGVGISETDIALITKKFYRSGIHDWDNSMGIGLSIVKQILKLHNSELKIISKINEGSSFSFAISSSLNLYSITPKNGLTFQA